MNNESQLKFLLGEDTDGNKVYGDFRQTGHFVSCGHVGSGHASYDEGAFVMSLLQDYSSEYLKFIMIDPKQVQLNPYEGIPHLLAPVAYTPDDAKAAVNLLLDELGRRLELFSQSGVNDIESYNEQFAERLPYIVLLATEIADLMMIDRPFYQGSFISLAMKARAVGIHMYLATQRPSADVFSDELLANISGHIAFAVASEVDSQRLLNQAGAELITKVGELLFRDAATGQTTRIRASYASDEEILRKAEQLKQS